MLLASNYRESLYAGLELANFHDGISYDARVWPERGGRMIIKQPGGPPRVGVPSDFFTLQGDAKLVRNSIGLLVTAPANAATVEFDYVGNLIGWLIEPTARTNICFQNQDYSVSPWVLNESSTVTVTPDNATGPDGAMSASTLFESAALAEHVIGQDIITFVNGTTYTVSTMVAAAGRSWVLISIGAAAFSSFTGFWFNLATGAIGTTFNAPTKIWTQRYAGGWWQIGFTKTATANSNARLRIYPGIADNGGTYQGTSIAALQLLYGQVEVGGAMTSPMPTVGAGGSRAADRVFRTIGAEMDRQKGTFVARYRLGIGNKTANQFLLYASDNSYNNSAAILSSSTGLPALSVNSNTGFAGLSSGAAPLPDLTLIKHAGAWQLDDVQNVLDGTLSAVDNAAPVPLALTRLDIGSDQAGAAANACESLWVQAFDIYPERKSNAFMQAANLR